MAVGDHILKRGEELEAEFLTGEGKGRRLVPTRNGRPLIFAPAPIKSPRPKSSTGTQTVHFSHKFVSKTRSGAFTAVANSSGKVGRAAAHAAYIERPDAAERVPLSTQGPAREIGLASPSVLNEIYIERQGAAEQVPSEAENAHAEQFSLASFGNIGDTPEDRINFWKEVEATEADPGKDRLALDLTDGANRLWWQSIMRRADCPPFLTALNLNKKHLNFPLDDAEIDLAKQYLAGFPLPDSAKAAYQIRSARGGRTQNRIIAELPHELSPVQRLAIVHTFCQEFEKRGLPYWAVIHAPDDHNDSRNFHVHIAYYDRPCKKLSDGRWDFAVVEDYRDRWNRPHKRYPHRQDKQREVSARDWVPRLRQRWCAVNNQVLRAAGLRKQYDPRSYADMGIAKLPDQHLGTRAAAMEARGIVTPAGQQNAVGHLSQELDQIRQRHVATATQIDKSGHRAADLLALRKKLALRQAEREILDLEINRRGQRALQVKQHCQKTLGRITTGRATKSEIRDRDTVISHEGRANQYLARLSVAFADMIRDLDPQGPTERQLRQQLKEMEMATPASAVAKPDPETMADPISQIANDRRRVEKTKSGFRIQGIPDERIQQLAAGSGAKRLTAIAAIQDKEIARLRLWLAQNKGVWSHSSGGIQAPSAPKAVATLLAHWGKLPEAIPANPNSQPPAQIISPRGRGRGRDD